MAVKLRLQRQGRKRKPFYHIVVADARAPRDGKYIEKIGSYNPNTVPAIIDIDFYKSYEWLEKGAQPTNTVNAIMRYKGVLYFKHLMRGVKKGSFSEEKAREIFQEWLDDKLSKITDTAERARLAEEARHAAIVGTPVEVVVEEVIEEAPAEVEASTEDATEAEAPAVEESTDEEAAPEATKE